MTIPDEFTEEEKVSGMWWRQLVAGGGAGVGEHFAFPNQVNYLQITSLYSIGKISSFHNFSPQSVVQQVPQCITDSYATDTQEVSRLHAEIQKGNAVN